jgi:hypothetical protein
MNWKVPTAIVAVLTMPIWIWFWPLLAAAALTVWFFLVRQKPVPLRSVAVSADTRRNAAHAQIVATVYAGVRTLDAQFRQSVERFGALPCLGARKELGTVAVKKTVVVDGTPVEKTLNIVRKQRTFEWQTYDEVYAEIRAFGAGLVASGLQARWSDGEQWSYQ